MKIIEMMFYGVTTKGVLQTFIESYSNFPITFFNIFKAPFISLLVRRMGFEPMTPKLLQIEESNLS